MSSRPILSQEEYRVIKMIKKNYSLLYDILMNQFRNQKLTFDELATYGINTKITLPEIDELLKKYNKNGLISYLYKHVCKYNWDLVNEQIQQNIDFLNEHGELAEQLYLYNKDWERAKRSLTPEYYEGVWDSEVAFAVENNLLELDKGWNKKRYIYEVEEQTKKLFGNFGLAKGGEYYSLPTEDPKMPKDNLVVHIFKEIS